MPNAKDEMRKLQEALKGKAEDLGSTDGMMAKKTRAGRKGLPKANSVKPSRKLDGQTAEKVVVQNSPQANTNQTKSEGS